MVSHISRVLWSLERARHGVGWYLDSGCFLLWFHLFHLHPRPNSPKLPASHQSAGALHPLLPSEAWFLGHSEGWGGEGIPWTWVTTGAGIGGGVRCGAGWVLVSGVGSTHSSVSRVPSGVLAPPSCRGGSRQCPLLKGIKIPPVRRCGVPCGLCRFCPGCQLRGLRMDLGCCRVLGSLGLNLLRFSRLQRAGFSGPRRSLLLLCLPGFQKELSEPLQPL